MFLSLGRAQARGNNRQRMSALIDDLCALFIALQVIIAMCTFESRRKPASFGVGRNAGDQNFERTKEQVRLWSNRRNSQHRLSKRSNNALEAHNDADLKSKRSAPCASAISTAPRPAKPLRPWLDCEVLRYHCLPGHLDASPCHPCHEL